MLSSPDAYRSTLAAFYGFFAVVEPRLEAALPGPAFYPARRKLPLIQADLHMLGLRAEAVARLPHCRWTPSSLSRHDALGTLYVLEGATLGGAIVARAVADRLGLNGPTAYFAAYGRRRDQMWEALKVRLLASEGPEDWQAIRAAQECFASLEIWLEGSRWWGGAQMAPARATRFRT